MKKYRGFGNFLYGHKEIFQTIPDLAQFAGREFITVNAESKRVKQTRITKQVRKELPLRRLARLLWSGYRAVK